MRTWANTHREQSPPLRTPEAMLKDPVHEGARSGSSPFDAARQYWLSLLAEPARAASPALEPTPPPRSERALASLFRAEEPEAEAAPAPARNSFRREGDYWQIAYEGVRIAVRNLKGLFYIQYLLLHPGERLHVSHLAALGERRVSADPAPVEVASSGLEIRSAPSDAGAVLDARATQEYKARLVELREELDEATRWADIERADSIRHEIAFLTAQLTAAYGPSGAARKMGDPSDRLRKAVTKCIREAIDRVSKQHPSLGRHLGNAIRMGFYCIYSPEVLIPWQS
jgi:hypothetical protein